MLTYCHVLLVFLFIFSFYKQTFAEFDEEVESFEIPGLVYGNDDCEFFGCNQKDDLASLALVKDVFDLSYLIPLQDNKNRVAFCLEPVEIVNSDLNNKIFLDCVSDDEVFINYPQKHVHFEEKMLCLPDEDNFENLSIMQRFARFIGFA